MAMASLHWPQPTVRHCSPCSASPSLHTLASAFTTDVVFCRNYHQRSDLPAVTKSFLHSSCSRLSLSASITRALSASLDAFSDDDDGIFFNSGEINGIKDSSENCRRSHSRVGSSSSSSSMLDPSMELKINREPPDWFGRDELEIEQKAKCLDLPLSIRIIKKKRQQQVRRQQLRKEEEEGVHDQSSCRYPSMKRAFSSMVSIIQELNSYTLSRLKEQLVYYDVDLQEMRMTRVQMEIQESFILIFKQVFSQTPSLMLSLMILHADFSVSSVLTNPVLSQSAASSATPAQDVGPACRDENGIVPKLDSSSAVKTSTLSVSGGKTSSVVGGMGGDRNSRPVVTSGADGEGGWVDDSSDIRRPIVPEAKGERESEEKELRLWNSIVEEAQRMRWEAHHHQQQQQQQLVSPDSGYDDEDFTRTELAYVMGLAQEPNNPLLLANFAQFLCLVARDYDRAEEYFKRATEIEPKDAEAFNKYASFLWQIRNDLWAAEETFLEAISADPGNTFYASNYANFLWNTGGTDTCYPLDGPEEDGPDVEGGYCL